MPIGIETRSALRAGIRILRHNEGRMPIGIETLFDRVAESSFGDVTMRGECR